MPYHTHKLNSSHSHIIGRTDPITGDSVKENDNVVFCAVCKSCFLKESWVYMNENHCEQSQTLYAVPVLASKLVARKITQEVIIKFKKEVSFIWIGSMTILLSFFFFLFFFAKSNYVSGTTFTNLASFICSILLGLGLSFITSTNSFRKLIGFEQQDLFLFKDKIKIGKEVFYWKDIKQVKFQREMDSYIEKENIHTASKTPVLFLYFHDGTRQIKNLPTRNYKNIEKFLKGLAQISKFTEVYLYSEQSQEYIIIKRIKANTKGNIIVGEPFRLLADSNYPNQF
ncbi:hypothetical protein WAF17_04270 [Bernardetia sp. ABR2-2B]|uniref:hypothetical protein n=1 Tax=Bernardetia sp. ABR2-2B TaxID=3127472 RepID=UPI0030D21456